MNEWLKIHRARKSKWSLCRIRPLDLEAHHRRNQL